MNKAKKDVENAKNPEELEKIVKAIPEYVRMALRTTIINKAVELNK